MDRIKRLSYDVLDKHKSKFGESFSDNKKVLGEVSIIRSKGLKNEIAGYITKFIKKEIRDMKAKQEQIDAAHANELAEQAAKAAQEENQVVGETDVVEVSDVEQVVGETDVVEVSDVEQVVEEVNAEKPAEVSDVEQVVEEVNAEKPAEVSEIPQESKPQAATAAEAEGTPAKAE